MAKSWVPLLLALLSAAAAATQEEETSLLQAKTLEGRRRGGDYNVTGPSVNCGYGFSAPTCDACAGGMPDYCSGDCKWDKATTWCVRKQVPCGSGSKTPTANFCGECGDDASSCWSKDCEWNFEQKVCEWKQTLTSCGAHKTASCYECSAVHGASWCNGDCCWNDWNDKAKQPVCDYTCPLTRPTSSIPCPPSREGFECGYDPAACWNNPEPVYSTRAVCTKGRWEIREQARACPPTPDECSLLVNSCDLCLQSSCGSWVPNWDSHPLGQGRMSLCCASTQAGAGGCPTDVDCAKAAHDMKKEKECDVHNKPGGNYDVCACKAAGCVPQERGCRFRPQVLDNTVSSWFCES